MRPLITIFRVPPHLPFVRIHRLGFLLSALLIAVSLASLATRGINFGIDFRGGIVMDVKSGDGKPLRLDDMRATLGGLGIGEPSLQTYGAPNDVLIRLPRQPGDDAAQERVVELARKALGPGYDYRRTEVVGPKVGGELIHAGILATLASVAAIAGYVWFRFEWQFGIGAVVSLTHDVVTALGLFSILQLEFNLATLAAILTIAGYSINDKVVIFDRVRESLRKYRSMALPELIDLALNETLSRTVLTSTVTGLSVLALLLFGGSVIRGFSAAMLWGIVVGTYSSLFIAAPLLLYIRPNRQNQAVAGSAAKAPARTK